MLFIYTKQSKLTLILLSFLFHSSLVFILPSFKPNFSFPSFPLPLLKTKQRRGLGGWDGAHYVTMPKFLYYNTKCRMKNKILQSSSQKELDYTKENWGKKK